MKSVFEIYFELGIKHIADFGAYDHILFVVALSATFNLSTWKRLVFLITAFTVGHSLTLLLSVLNIIQFDTKIIEFLIPITIIFSCLLNIFQNKNNQSSIMYALVLGFGFIHGMGFSNYLKSLLGAESSIIQPLFAFNLGLEVGQLAIVFVVVFFRNFVPKSI